MRPSHRTNTFFVLLVLATLGAYLPALSAGFVWDDDAYVEHNAVLRAADGLWRIWTDPTSIPQYYPLVHTTFYLEYRLYGLHPLGYHLVNVLLHLGSAGALFALLRRLRVPAAPLATALFALHPVMAESVAWVTERKNVLSLLFYLLSAIAYLRWLAARRRGGWWLAFGLFLAALTSKSVTFSLPFALLVVFWWQRGRVTWTDALPLVPFAVVGIGYGCLTTYLEHAHVGAQGAEFELGWAERFLIAGRTPWFYLGKLVWPYPLLFIYERWPVDPAAVWQWGFPIATGAALALAWGLRGRWGRGPLAVLLLFGGTLFPALGFIVVYPFRYSFVADHFQYHASLAVLAGGCALAARLGRSLPKPAAVAMVLAVLGTCAVRTFVEVGKYESRETLYESILVHDPDSFFAIHNLGAIYVVRGEHQRGIDFYTRAKQLRPELAPGPQIGAAAFAHCMAGKMLARKYSLEPALRAFVAAGDPSRAADRGELLAECARINAALSPDLEIVSGFFRKAIELEPKYVDALVDAAKVLHAWGLTHPDGRVSTPRLLEAVGYLDRAVATQPQHAAARRRAVQIHQTLAEGLAAMGQMAAARRHHEAAQRLAAGR